MTHEFHFAIDACRACADACTRCAEASASPRMHALAADTAAVCELAAELMQRHSELAEVLADACAAACETYARECGCQAQQVCKHAADAARDCAGQCRRMAAGYLGRKYEAPSGGSYAG